MTNASHIRIDGNAVILISSGLRVEFPWPVAKVLEFENSYVIRIRPEPGSGFNENVFGVASDGALLWQIETRRRPVKPRRSVPSATITAPLRITTTTAR